MSRNTEKNYFWRAEATFAFHLLVFSLERQRPAGTGSFVSAFGEKKDDILNQYLWYPNTLCMCTVYCTTLYIFVFDAQRHTASLSTQ
jgi:hypothetical protein